jgi:WS/DGAT/MGAT family acyltransferase
VGHAERLGAIDASFLANETPNAHMQVAAVLVFEGGALLRPDGGVDAPRIRRVVEAGLAGLPRFRQRIERVPLEGHPVWVDDPHFDVGTHVRHVALPRPGDERQLKRLGGWLLSQPLDRRRPLWELWLIEGLAQGRFALIPKLHHCMTDGLAAVGALAALLAQDPGAGEAAQATRPFRPRPAPGGAELLAGALLARAREPLRLAGAALRSLRAPRQSLASLAADAGGAAAAVLEGLRPAPATPLNPPHIGPNRRLDWLRTPMDRIQEVRERLGGTLNDVALAAAGGALGSFLRQRAGGPLPPTLRTLVPASVRLPGEGSEVANRLVPLMLELPIGAQDAAERLRSVAAQTRRLKGSRRVRGAKLVEEVGDWLAPGLAREAIHLAWRLRSFNLVVTNVPGPAQPVYLLGARLREVHPVVPLLESQALGIALFSYDGWLHFGLNADRDLVPDLHELVGCIGHELDALSEAAARGAQN